MSFDLATFGSAITGAIVGGLITGFFAIKATTKSFDHQKEFNRYRENRNAEEGSGPSEGSENSKADSKYSVPGREPTGGDTAYQVCASGLRSS